jgi:hypothetical protein
MDEYKHKKTTEHATRCQTRRRSFFAVLRHISMAALRLQSYNKTLPVGSRFAVSVARPPFA